MCQQDNIQQYKTQANTSPLESGEYSDKIQVKNLGTLS